MLSLTGRGPARRAFRVILVAVAFAAILLLFVLPGRTFLSQERTLATTERQVNDLAAENAKLRAEARNLQSDSVIEQIAREQYGLVMPGEKAYAVIPATPGTTTPATHRGNRRPPARAASTTTTSTTLPRRQ